MNIEKYRPHKLRESERLFVREVERQISEGGCLLKDLHEKQELLITNELWENIWVANGDKDFVNAEAYVNSCFRGQEQMSEVVRRKIEAIEKHRDDTNDPVIIYGVIEEKTRRGKILHFLFIDREVWSYGLMHRHYELDHKLLSFTWDFYDDDTVQNSYIEEADRFIDIDKIDYADMTDVALCRVSVMSNSTLWDEKPEEEDGQNNDVCDK